MIPRVQVPHSHSPSFHPPHSALYRVHPSHHPISAPQYYQPSPRMGLDKRSHSAHQSNSGIPSSASAGMDPSAVDFRAFYPYTPNEVKHRKRTTSAQLKILEGIFKRDTKPNGVLRNKLAVELGMTARGVQVWFQNRRAKEKTKAGKTTGKGTPAPEPGSNDAFARDRTPSPRSSETDLVPDAPSEHQQSPASLDLELGETSSQESSPVQTSPPSLHVITDSCNSSWQSSPIETPDEPSFLGQSNEAHIIGLRRGSLPVNAFPHGHHSSYGPPLLDHLDPLARRRSVDASLQRLASNPYAHLARAKNGALFGTRLTPYSLGRHHQGDRAALYTSQPNSRPGLPHRASMPHGLAGLDVRRSSMDSRAFSFHQADFPASPSPSPLSPYHAVRASLPGPHHYALSTRTVSSPLPGPLPSPGFSFGAASSSSLASPSSADSERNSPDPSHGFAFRTDDVDTEDDQTSASYDALSRFGSIASIATSESSNTSAYYSDVGSIADHESAAGFGPGVRRGSCASGHFLGLMSDLGMNGLSRNASFNDPLASPVNQSCYSPQEDLPSAVGIETDSHSPNGGDNGTAAYPSPSSTVSPGPHAQDASSTAVPISRSSELAYALHVQTDQVFESGCGKLTPYPHDAPDTEADAPGAAHDITPYFFPEEQDYVRSPSASSNSAMGFADKFSFDSEMSSMPPNGHYHPYTSTGDNQYNVGSFATSEGQEELGIHQIEFAQSDVYPTFNGGSVDPSAVTSIENNLCAVESFAPFS
jgi:hypothetical protein